MTREAYPTDLTDEQWALLEPLSPAAKPGGRPRSADLRAVVDARAPERRRLAAVAARGPAVGHGLERRPPLARRRHAGPAARRIARPGAGSGRPRRPTERRVPGQPVREDGRRRGPRLRRRQAGSRAKRYLVVDTLGLIHGVAVHPASVQDRDGARLVLSPWPTPCRGWSASGPTAAAPASWSSGCGSEPAGIWRSSSARGGHRLRRLAEALDRGARLRLVGQVPAPEPGLRAPDRLLRSDDPRGDDRPHDPPPETSTLTSHTLLSRALDGTRPGRCHDLDRVIDVRTGVAVAETRGAREGGGAGSGGVGVWRTGFGAACLRRVTKRGERVRVDCGGAARGEAGRPSPRWRSRRAALPRGAERRSQFLTTSSWSTIAVSTSRPLASSPQSMSSASAGRPCGSSALTESLPVPARMVSMPRPPSMKSFPAPPKRRSIAELAVDRVVTSPPVGEVVARVGRDLRPARRGPLMVSGTKEESVRGW